MNQVLIFAYTISSVALLAASGFVSPTSIVPTQTSALFFAPIYRFVLMKIRQKRMYTMSKQSQKTASIFLMILLVIFVSSLVIKTLLEELDSVTTGNIELLKTPDPLETELSNTVSRYKNNDITIIDLSAITTFSWDRLYMFGDYTSNSDIDSIVGRSWRELCYTQVGASDGYTLLIFTKNQAVVHCLDYPKIMGDFRIPEQA